MIELSDETEALIRAQASKMGRTPEEILRAALVRAGEVLPWRSGGRPRPPAMNKAELIAEMEEIAARSTVRPLVDPRSPDEIIGYDDFGLPR
jgi:antitoxin VapB